MRYILFVLVATDQSYVNCNFPHSEVQQVFLHWQDNPLGCTTFDFGDIFFTFFYWAVVGKAKLKSRFAQMPRTTFKEHGWHVTKWRRGKTQAPYLTRLRGEGERGFLKKQEIVL